MRTYELYKNYLFIYRFCLHAALLLLKHNKEKK